MQVHFSFQHGSRTPQLDKIIDSHVRKLSVLLVRFSPDLVHLHGLVEFGAAHHKPLCSLDLWLPTTRLHAREQGPDLAAALRVSFNQLREQLKKHKEVLRREADWKRKRIRARQEVNA